MKKSKPGLCCLALGLLRLAAWRCDGAFLQTSLDQDAVYTPGCVDLVMNVSKEAALVEQYSFRVTLFCGETVIRDQPLPGSQDEPTTFEVVVPEVRERTDLRCRVELLVGGRFVEAAEKPLALWPPLSPFAEQPKGKVLWTFDTSGALQRIFSELQVQAVDATFQPVRDFQTPDVVFVGENTDLQSLENLRSRLDSQPKSDRRIVFLRQSRFPEEWNVEVPAKAEPLRRFCHDPNSVLLSGLNQLDIMHMARNAVPVGLADKKQKEGSVVSHVGEPAEAGKAMLSYMVAVQEEVLTSIYCQLPITEDFEADPRSAALLCNLLEFVFQKDNAEND